MCRPADGRKALTNRAVCDMLALPDSAAARAERFLKETGPDAAVSRRRTALSGEAGRHRFYREDGYELSTSCYMR